MKSEKSLLGRTKKSRISSYHNSVWKRGFDVLASGVGVFLLLPAFFLIGLLIWASSGRPIIFRQKRLGIGGGWFWMFKFRTMEVGADQKKTAMMSMNEADGPVFKIRLDPRYVGIGKWLSWLGLDELPQLWNVLIGKMSLVGPRPLPLDEAQRVPAKYSCRYAIRPGLTSRWVFEGSHRLSFEEWMKRDIQYVETATFTEDIEILFQTVKMIVRSAYFLASRQEDKLR